jgi:hypothetical protein
MKYPNHKNMNRILPPALAWACIVVIIGLGIVHLRVLAWHQRMDEDAAQAALNYDTELAQQRLADDLRNAQQQMETNIAAAYDRYQKATHP